MGTPANSLDITQSGLVNFDGVNNFTGITVNQYSVLTGSSSNGIISVGPGSAGQILQSNGNNTPIYSTATYPSTALSSGNVLMADGTNWNSATAPGGGIMTVTKNITSAQIKTLHAVPIELIPSPGIGKGIVIVSTAAKFNYGGNNVFVASASQTISLYYNNGTTLYVNPIPNTVIISNSNRFSIAPPTATLNSTVAGILDNVNMAIFNPIATEISGNAAGDNNIDFIVNYWIVTF